MLRTISLALAALTLASISLLSAQGTIEEGKARNDLLSGELQRFRARSQSAPLHIAADNNIDVTYYRLNIMVSTNPQFVAGDVMMKARSLKAGLTSIVLDMNNTLVLDSIVAEGVQLSAVADTNFFTVMLNRAYGLNELVTLDIYYKGFPLPNDFGSFVFDTAVGGKPWIWSLSEPYGSRDWWPNKDHPSDKADSSDVIITCDASLKVGSNGKLISRVDNGDGTATTHWSERYPIASYLISVAITNYAEFSDWFHYSPTDSMQVLNYVLPQDSATWRPQLAKTVDMLAIYSDLFGTYPFLREKYGHSQFGWGGAMEHQTMTSTVTPSEYIIAHELAHQWFGDMITLRTWPDLWLNEGFATYCEELYAEKMYGFSTYKSRINNYMASAKTFNSPVYTSDTSNPFILFSSNGVYAKGASALHMLRHVIGDTTFFRSMFNYANDSRFKYKTASTGDFRSVCEQTSGKDLTYFFDEWIFGQGYPTYTYSWQQHAGAHDSVSVSISQPGGNNPAFFTMPLDFRLYSGTWDTTIVLFNNQQQQTFWVGVSRTIDSAKLDPDNWILRDIQFVPTGVTQSNMAPRKYRLEQNYPNPFNPATFIRYEIPARTFVTLTIFDALGREIATLVNGIQEPGVREILFDASRIGSGVYFYQLRAGSYTSVKKMVLLK